MPALSVTPPLKAFELFARSLPIFLKPALSNRRAARMASSSGLAVALAVTSSGTTYRPLAASAASTIDDIVLKPPRASSDLSRFRTFRD
jgi:hypothetical protein